MNKGAVSLIASAILFVVIFVVARYLGAPAWAAFLGAAIYTRLADGFSPE